MAFKAIGEGASALWDLVKAPLARPTAGQAVDYAGTKLTVDISPRELDTPEGMQAFIDKYGRKPLHTMDQSERTITFAKRPEHADLLADPHDLVDVGGVQVPGGLDGTFNLSDMFYLKNSGINPRLLPEPLHAAIHKKMLRSVAKEDPTSALEQFDRLGFGITSGNAPLTKNEIEWAQLRPRSEDELARLGESYPGSSSARAENAVAAGTAGAPENAEAFAQDQLQAIPVGSPRPTERQNLSFLAPEMYRQVEETRRVVSDFAQRRAPKASFWKQKRDELLELAGAGIGAAVNAGINTVANNPLTSALAFQGGRYLEASQQPVQGVSALSALIASGDLDTAANVARMPQEQIADEAGGLVTDYLSQAGYPGIAPAAGTAVNVGINMAGF